MTIKDELFLRKLYRTFCGRSVTGPRSRIAIQTRKIEIEERDHEVRHQLGEKVKSILTRIIVVSIHDGEGSLMDIGFYRDRAWAMRTLTVDKALHDADVEEFSTFVRRFLLKHGVIDRQGNSRLEGVA